MGKQKIPDRESWSTAKGLRGDTAACKQRGALGQDMVRLLHRHITKADLIEKLTLIKIKIKTLN